MSGCLRGLVYTCTCVCMYTRLGNGSQLAIV